MTILHVHTDLVGGGIERMMVTLATHTSAAGVAICWCPASHPEPAPDTLRAITDSGVTLHRIPPPFLSPAYPARLARLVAEIRPDVLHLHGATVGVIGSLVGRALRVPAIVYTEHLEHARHAPWLQHARELTCDWPHHTVFVSGQSYRGAMQHAPLAVLACRASVIQNGIDLAPYVAPPIPEERVRLRRALGLGAEDVAIGSVGLLWRAKGQEHLLRALARLQDVVVFLVGSGADEKPLRDLAVDLGITGRVRFLGWRDDVRQLLQAVDLYVQPSLTEGLPLAVVEAGAAGLPIVASDVGGIPEIITHGANGLLVPPGDPQALAQAIQKLIEDPRMARRLGDAASQAAFERFSAEAMAERYMQLYERLLRDVR